ncbi:MAG TPA: dTDP-4-dehydrorhamnose reductase [Casimicrobiaceae bacterium]
MKILVTGARGQLGHELAAALASAGTVVALDHDALNLAHGDRVVEIVRSVAPMLIVNAAAYTAVDRAEEERASAFSVNANAPAILADEAKRLRALLIHYSTDYVFDGQQTSPYVEDATPHPLNAYGESKLAGERAIASSGASALILRTSWVYSLRGSNFLLTMRRLAAERDELRVVADQVGVPNWARILAQATATLVGRGIPYLTERSGLYHVSASGQATWYEFARAILGETTKPRIVPIATADYPLPARRPAYGVLDSRKFESVFGFALPHWRAALQSCLAGPADAPTSPTAAFGSDKNEASNTPTLR